MSDTRRKLLEQNLAHFTASLAWTANKDQVRRQILPPRKHYFARRCKGKTDTRSPVTVLGRSDSRHGYVGTSHT